MLTKDDLKNIRDVVKEEVDKRAEETELKMELKFSAVDKRFEKLEKQMDNRFNAVEKQMEQDRHDWSQFSVTPESFLIN